MVNEVEGSWAGTSLDRALIREAGNRRVAPVVCCMDRNELAGKIDVPARNWGLGKYGIVPPQGS